MSEVSRQRHSFHCNPEQDASEASATIRQNGPPTAEKEKPNSEVTNYTTDQSMDSNVEIRRRTVTSTGNYELGQETREDTSTLCNKNKNERASQVISFLILGIIAILVLLAPVLTTIGYKNLDECPGNFFLPYVVLIVCPMYLSCSAIASLRLRGANSHSLQENHTVSKSAVAETCCFLFLLLWLCEMALFLFTNVSFNSSAANYCDFWFYVLVLVWNIFLVLFFAMGSAIILMDLDLVKE